MIKLIKNPFGYYLYDARVNRIVEVSERLYQAYRCNDKKLMESLDEYKRMQKDGFFNNNEFSICFGNKGILKSMYERGLHSMVLQVTQNCNFRCTYCPYTSNSGNLRVHSDKTMPIEVALKAVDFLYEHSIDAKQIVLGFYGGEPLLRFDTIRTVMEYAKKKFEEKELRFMLTSNATLLSEEILTYFNNNNVTLLVSLDGPKDVNDAHRVFAGSGGGTFDVIIRKLDEIAKKYPALKERTSINMVVDPSIDYEDYRKIYEDPIIKDNFSIAAQLVDSSDLSETFYATDEFITNYNYYEFIDALWENGMVTEEAYRSVFTPRNKWGKRDKYKPFESPRIGSTGYPGGPCIPGYMKLFVDVNGKFFPCEKVSEINEAMHLGDIDSGIDLKKCEVLLNMPRITEEECKKCWNFHFCSSCHVRACGKKGLDKEKRLMHCENTKDATENLLRRYVIENRKKVKVYK